MKNALLSGLMLIGMAEDAGIKYNLNFNYRQNITILLWDPATNGYGPSFCYGLLSSEHSSATLRYTNDLDEYKKIVITEIERIKKNAEG